MSLCGTKECHEVKYGFCLEPLQGYECGEKPDEKPTFRERCKVGSKELYRKETNYYTELGL